MTPAQWKAFHANEGASLDLDAIVRAARRGRPNQRTAAVMILA